MSLLEKNCKVCEAKNLNIGDKILTQDGYKKITSICAGGVGNCYDITLFRDDNLFCGEPNFILGNGVVSHNCNLAIISDCIKFIETTTGHKLQRKDVPINDRDAIRFCSKNDMVGIFQFENPATKPIADKVGMDSIFDISAVTSLIRPGPKDMGMDIEYAERKHGKPYDMPEFLRNVMSETYGVMTYQEDVQKIAQVLACFTPLEANKLRKVTSKKMKEETQKMKVKFIDGSKKRVNEGKITMPEVEYIWQLIESFSGYGFNRSIDNNFIIPLSNGSTKKASCVAAGDKVRCLDEMTGAVVETTVVANHDHGILPAFEVTFEGGSTVICSINHKFLTLEGQKPLHEILNRRMEVIHAEATASEESHLSLRGSIFQQTRIVESQKNLQASIGSGECEPQEEVLCKSGKGKSLSGFASRTQKPVRETSICHCSVQSSDFENKSRNNGSSEQDPRSKTTSIKDSNQDIGETRRTVVPCGQSSSLAGGKSRTVYCQSQKRTNGKKGFQGRSLVRTECLVWTRFPSECSSEVRRHNEASRFRSGRILDRSRRMLAFRDELYGETLQCGTNPCQRYNAERGSRATWNHSCTTWTELLARERETHSKGRLDCHSERPYFQSQSRNVSLRRVLSARYVGERQMCDLEVSHPSHNYILTGGIVTSNSHAMSYSAITAVEFWLKFHYPAEYISALLNNTDPGKKKFGNESLIVGYINYARQRRMDVLSPNINKSKAFFTIENGNIRYALGHVKNVGSSAEDIEKLQPFVDMPDFFNRVNKRKVNKRVVSSLIDAGAFDEMFPDRQSAVEEYHKLRKDKKASIPEPILESKWIEREKIAIGVCLSKPPILREFSKVIEEKKLCTISHLSSKDNAVVFGRIESVVPRVSKAGNDMYIVQLTDDIDTISFFVFSKSKICFTNNFKAGWIVGIPLSKFEDSDTRFFDSTATVKGRGCVIQK